MNDAEIEREIQATKIACRAIIKATMASLDSTAQRLQFIADIKGEAEIQRQEGRTESGRDQAQRLTTAQVIEKMIDGL